MEWIIGIGILVGIVIWQRKAIFRLGKTGQAVGEDIARQAENANLVALARQDHRNQVSALNNLAAAIAAQETAVGNARAHRDELSTKIAEREAENEAAKALASETPQDSEDYNQIVAAVASNLDTIEVLKAQLEQANTAVTQAEDFLADQLVQLEDAGRAVAEMAETIESESTKKEINDALTAAQNSSASFQNSGFGKSDYLKRLRDQNQTGLNAHKLRTNVASGGSQEKVRKKLQERARTDAARALLGQTAPPNTPAAAPAPVPQAPQATDEPTELNPAPRQD